MVSLCLRKYHPVKVLSRGGIHPRNVNFLVSLNRGSLDSSAGVDTVHKMKFYAENRTSVLQSSSP